MKKILLYLLVLIIVIGVCCFTLVCNYYAPPRLQKPYKTPVQGDTLRIAYIGDSWAYLHGFHNCMIPCLLESRLHRPVKIYTVGIPGLTSKELYEYMFLDDGFKPFFMERYYSIAFIAVGVNDADKKMSTFYYKKSMEGIITFLLANDITPILLEMPDFDIEKSFERQGLLRGCMRKIAMYINVIPLDCKQLFRKALNDLILENKQRQVGVVRYKSWNTNYAEDIHNLYWNDGLHLNEKGYEKLDTAIFAEILNMIK